MLRAKLQMPKLSFPFYNTKSTQVQKKLGYHKTMLRIQYLPFLVLMTITIFSYQTEIQQNATEVEPQNINSQLEMSFDDYIVKYQKMYRNQEEKQQKCKIFEANVKKLKESRCSACGINKFTDHTEAQIQELRGIRGQQSTADMGISASGMFASASSMETGPLVNNKNTSNSSLPKSFDWRNYDVITSVKNQQNCGVCWSFSTCGFFESQLIRRGQAKLNIDLAEQYLYQCDSSSNGCNGGNLFSAMDLALSTGLPFESEYPYYPKFGYPGICKVGRGPTFPFSQRVTYSNISDSQIISYLLQRPLNIGLKSKNWDKYAPTAKDRTFECQEIKNGMNQLDHAVLLIGYTQTEWIVKNQWGADWGVNGYIYVSRNPKSNCGIGLQINTLNYRLKSIVFTSDTNSINTTNSTDSMNTASRSANTNAAASSTNGDKSQSQTDPKSKSQIIKIASQQINNSQNLKSTNVQSSNLNSQPTNIVSDSNPNNLRSPIGQQSPNLKLQQNMKSSN